MKILVTGCAGFIGMHTSISLLKEGHEVVGIDNLNAYYDVFLKKSRLKILKQYNSFLFFEENIANKSELKKIFSTTKPTRVVHLAAQAGVRYSFKNPYAYVESNFEGFVNILEECKQHQVDHFVFASSSNVYGSNTKIPFKENDNVDHPLSLYGATKKGNELIAHTYSSLFKIPCTGLRFFSVYGPWGRPDMALFIFTKSIIEKKPIEVYNSGNLKRDFTYIDDIVQSLVKVIKKPAKPHPSFDSKNPQPSISDSPYRIFNLGNGNPVNLLKFIEHIEVTLKIKAKKINKPMQQGDVLSTFSDTTALNEWIGFKPNTSIEDGIEKFVSWYKEFYSIKL